VIGKVWSRTTWVDRILVLLVLVALVATLALGDWLGVAVSVGLLGMLAGSRWTAERRKPETVELRR
jgi:uncharacterized protein (DUF58 family)